MRMSCHVKSDIFLYSRFLGHFFQVSVCHLVGRYREYMISPFSFVVCFIPL